MTVGIPALSGVLAAVVWLGLSGQEPRRQATFRARVDRVLVDVSVMSRGRPVDGLAASAFEVLDNGVRQQVEVLRGLPLPLDVTIVVNLGGGMTVGGALSTFADPQRFADVAARIRRMVALLDRDDRLRLLTSDQGVRQVIPMIPAMNVPWADVERLRLSPLPGPSRDVLVHAMIWEGSADRRHLIVDFRTEDTSSTLHSSALVPVARLTDAVLFVVVTSGLGRGSPTHYREAAEQTGGELLEFGDTVRAFRDIVAGFRRRHILAYTPQGVAPTGWHDLIVRVFPPEKYQVRARKGYQRN